MNTINDPRAACPFPLPGNANVLGIALSRRNLETLLAKLDTPGSYATLVRQVSDGDHDLMAPCILVVKAEDNAEHYHSADRQADVRGIRGAMAGEASWADAVPVPSPEAEASRRALTGGEHGDSTSLNVGVRVHVHTASGWAPGTIIRGFKASGTWWYDVDTDGSTGLGVMRASSADIRMAAPC